MKKSRIFVVLTVMSVWSLSAGPLGLSKDAGRNVSARAILWKAPKDISSLDLLYGSGSRKEAPEPPFIFLEEDLDGTNPKFSVRDRNGVKWKVKLGVESQAEVAASRFLWAMGYFTDEYYFVPVLRVQKMPKLKRGEKLRGPDGSFYGARLKRESGRGKKVDNWRWRENPFSGTREFNGLRVMMAVINNWDLKTANNDVLDDHGSEIYMISDLGASFGTSNWIRPLDHAKGNLVSYNSARFIRKITDDHVDFNIAGRPAVVNAVNLPLYLKYTKMGWIGKSIPRGDARWVGQLLSRLSGKQIRDAFRAAGYSQHEIEGFTRIVLERIDQLRDL